MFRLNFCPRLAFFFFSGSECLFFCCSFFFGKNLFLVKTQQTEGVNYTTKTWNEHSKKDLNCMRGLSPGIRLNTNYINFTEGAFSP